MAEIYVKEKVINGKTYKAQFNGLGTALEAIDNSYVNNRLSIAKISKYIFENVIVDPNNLTADSFDTMEELNDVVSFGMAVMQGKFRNSDNTATEEHSKK